MTAFMIRPAAFTMASEGCWGGGRSGLGRARGDSWKEKGSTIKSVTSTTYSVVVGMAI